MFTWPTLVAVMDPIPVVISPYVTHSTATVLMLIIEACQMFFPYSTQLENGEPNNRASDIRNGLEFTRNEVTIEEFERRGTEESDFQDYLRNDWVPPIDVGKAYWSADDKKRVLQMFAKYVWRSTHRLRSATKQVYHVRKKIDALYLKIDRLTADLGEAQKVLAETEASSASDLATIASLRDQLRIALATTNPAPTVISYQAPIFKTCFSMNRFDWIPWSRSAQFWLAANTAVFPGPSGPAAACAWFCGLLSGDAKTMAEVHTATASAKGTPVLAIQELIDCLNIPYYDRNYQTNLRMALREVKQGSSSFGDFYLRFSAANCFISPAISEEECTWLFLDALHPNLVVALKTHYILAHTCPNKKTINEMAPILSRLDRIDHYPSCEDHDYDHTGSTCKYGKSQEDCKRDSEAVTAREKRPCGCPNHYTGPGRQCRDRGSHT